METEKKQKNLINLFENGIKYIEFKEIVKILITSNNLNQPSEWTNYMNKHELQNHFKIRFEIKKMIEISEYKIELVIDYLKCYHSSSFNKNQDAYLIVKWEHDITNYFKDEKIMFDLLELYIAK